MTIDHYHIRWADGTPDGKLDWEKFSTEQEAAEAAENMKRLDETYTIMPSLENCSQCDGIRAQRPLTRNLKRS